MLEISTQKSNTFHEPHDRHCDCGFVAASNVLKSKNEREINVKVLVAVCGKQMLTHKHKTKLTNNLLVLFRFSLSAARYGAM